MLTRAVRATLIPLLKEQNSELGSTGIPGHTEEGQFVSSLRVPPVQGAAAHLHGVAWERGRHVSAGDDGPSHGSPPYLSCFAACMCLLAQGIVRIHRESEGSLVSSPLLCNCSTTCQSGRACDVSVPHSSQEEGAARC